MVSLITTLDHIYYVGNTTWTGLQWVYVRIRSDKFASVSLMATGSCSMSTLVIEQTSENAPLTNYTYNNSSKYALLKRV